MSFWTSESCNFCTPHNVYLFWLCQIAREIKRDILQRTDGLTDYLLECGWGVGGWCWGDGALYNWVYVFSILKIWLYPASPTSDRIIAPITLSTGGPWDTLYSSCSALLSFHYRSLEKKEHRWDSEQKTDMHRSHPLSLRQYFFRYQSCK